jgi:hypothetical protein
MQTLRNAQAQLPSAPIPPRSKDRQATAATSARIREANSQFTLRALPSIVTMPGGIRTAHGLIVRWLRAGSIHLEKRLMQRRWDVFAVLAIASSLAVHSTLLAAPYASGVRDTGSNVWQFVLNAPADNVTVLRNGGNAENLGALAAGRHTFNMAGFNSFDIVVTDSAPAGWARISDPANRFTNFEQPTGLAINTDPSSPFFGTIYVNNSRTSATVSGRTMGAGIYALTSDLIGVDLANNFAPVTNANDTTQAKAPGWTPETGSSSPWRMTLDAGGNIILGDWSDDFGGVKYASGDLTAGGLVLNEESGPTGGVFSSVSDEQGPIPLHGSIASKPYVTGTVQSDLTLWAMDEDLDSDLEHPGDDGNSIWRWNVGDDTNHTINPTLVIDAGSIPQTTETTPRPNFVPTNSGTAVNAIYEPRFDKWYLTQRNGAGATGESSGLIVVTADDVDGKSPELEWSSLQFSIDNALDGNTALTGIQDIFKHAGSVAISPDGSQLFLHRSRMTDNANGDDTNPVLGPTSNAPGVVLVIPLDENGVPDLTVANGMVSNIGSITLTGNNLFKTNYEIDFDAAGNLYITHSDSELLEAYSPGGDTVATTSWNGSTFSFEIEAPSAGRNGDFNGDGKVDAADYVVWRKTDNSQPGYDEWRMNFGRTSGAAAGQVAGAVPEPASLALTAVGLLAAICFRRRA